MKILFINANLEIMPVPAMPLGLCKTASATEQAGHEVKVVDLAFQKDIKSVIQDGIAALQPEIVCIGVRNLDNADYLNTRPLLPIVEKTISMIRSCSESPIVIGGAAINVIGDAISSHLDADAFYIGEGELFPEVIADIGRSEKPVILTGQKVVDLNEFPNAEIPRWIDVKPYIAMDAPYPIQTKRGCSFNCTYCTYPKIEGKSYRLRKVESIVQEINGLYEKYGIDYFEFVDSVFNTPREFALEICGQLKALSKKIKYVAGGTNPVNFDEEFVQNLKEANFTAISFTVESGSDRMLKSYKKGFSVQNMVEASNILRKYRIPVMWIFLLGGPEESNETVDETLSFIQQHVKKSDVAYFNIGIRIYPETDIQGSAIRELQLTDDNRLVDPAFYFSNKLNIGELQEKLNKFARKNPNFIYSALVDGNAVVLGYKVISLLHLPRPAWRYTPYFNRLKYLFGF